MRNITSQNQLQITLSKTSLTKQIQEQYHNTKYVKFVFGPIITFENTSKLRHLHCCNTDVIHLTLYIHPKKQALGTCRNMSCKPNILVLKCKHNLGFLTKQEIQTPNSTVQSHLIIYITIVNLHNILLTVYIRNNLKTTRMCKMLFFKPAISP